MRRLTTVILLILCALPPRLWADDFDKYANWAAFQKAMAEEDHQETVDGISYILSGSIAIGAGFAGQGVSSDPIEKAVYSLFQSIGIVAVGYGAYSLKVGSEDHLLYSMLHDTKSLTYQERSEMLRVYEIHKKERARHERLVKALTHSMIAALNVYTATQQSRGPVQNGLYFIAGVNVLAAVSYTFTF